MIYGNGLACGIQGIGMISPWGDCFAAFAANYRAGNRAFAPITRFETGKLAVTQASMVNDFEPKKYMDPKDVRRYDQFSRLAIAASKIALASDSKPRSAEHLQEMGIVMACETQTMITANYLEGLVRDGSDQVSPKLFSVAAANSANCNVAIETGIQGTSVNVSAKYASGFLSAYTGAQIIAAGQAAECVVGSIDHLSQPVMEAYTRMGCYRTSPESQSGHIPGEGTAALVLSKDHSDCGKILGFGYICSIQQNYRWPTDIATQIEVLRKAKGDYKVDRYQSAANGDAGVDSVDQKAFEAVFSDGASRPEPVRLKEFLGEFSALPLFQVIAACAEPKGTRTLVSVLSPGGVHGAILVESTGWGG